MRFRTAFRTAILATLACFFVSAMAQEDPPAAAGPAGPAILDEFNLDVYGGADSSRVAAGLSFGNVLPSGMWWSYGGRLSWIHYVNDGPKIDGWGLGGTLGIGWDPDRVVSPVAGLSLEKAFSTDDLIDWQAHIHAGARVRITPDPEEYIALTFAVFSSAHVFGKGLPDQDDYGIAVLFSTARYALSAPNKPASKQRGEGTVPSLIDLPAVAAR